MDRRAHALSLVASLGGHALVVLGLQAHCPPPRAQATVADLVSEVTLPVSIIAQAEARGASPPSDAHAPAPARREPPRAEPRVTPTAERREPASDAPSEAAPEAQTVATPPEETAVNAAPGTPSASGLSGSSIVGSGTPSGSSVGMSTGDDADAVRAFVATLRARVNAARRYPRAAVERGLEGDVVVTLEITRDGSVRILSVSADNVPSMLVTAASDAVHDAGRFPFPPTLTRDVVRARLPIRFHLGE